MRILQLIIATCVATLIGCAGNFSNWEGREVQNTYSVPGFSKDSLYRTAKIWLSESFEGTKNGVTLDDKESGTIISHASIPFPCKDDYRCFGSQGDKLVFTMKIEIKDERYRVSYSNIRRRYPYDKNTGIPEHDVNTMFGDEYIIKTLLDIGGKVLENANKQRRTNDW